MLSMLSSILLSIIFLLIAALHFYWAAGGRWGVDAAAPVNEQGQKFLNTGTIPSIIVGSGLLLFASYYALPLIAFQILSPKILQVIGWIIPAIFLIRAVGDFRYVGLMKKLKTSRFAVQDTKYFTPLCLLIAALGFIVKLLN
jgi:hypothetical protein